MSEVNRTPRRKPPPPLGDDASPHTHSSEDPGVNRVVSEIRFDYEDPSLAPFLAYSAKEPTLPPLDITVERPPDEYADTTYDELILNFTSARAKGPQDLPPDPYFVPETSFLEEDEHSFLQQSPMETHENLLSPRRGSHSSKRWSGSTRKFQNLLQRGTSPAGSREWDRLGNPHLYENSPSPSNSRNNLPYPADEIHLSNESDLFPDISSYYELKGPTQLTPTQIPSLVSHDSIQKPNIDIPQPNILQNSYYFMRSSPPLFQTSVASSPELPNRFIRTSASSSPIRHLGHRRSSGDIFSPIADNSSSPSSSPRKYTSLKHLNNSTENESIFDQYDDHGEERFPEWSLIEHAELYFYDEQLDSFTEPYDFDYSKLPELPNVSMHTKTSSDALSLFISKQIPPPALKASVSSKKYGELPPVPMDLPSLEFSASSLMAGHFQECRNVWSLSEISNWCLKFSGWVNDQSISSKDFEKVLTKLLVFHKPNLSVDVIERNVKHLLMRLTETGLVVKSGEEDTRTCPITFRPSSIHISTGVLVELCPCYCRETDYVSNSYQISCYSSLCPINKRIAHENFMNEAVADDIILSNDWANHWGLTAHEISLDPSGSKKQSLLFDLIKFEQTFLNRANLFIGIAGPEFIRCATLLLAQNSSMTMLKMKTDILNSAKALAAIHHSELLNPLKNILISEGKFIRNIREIADVYFAWSKLVEEPLQQYMSVLPSIEDILSYEVFKGWDLNILNDPRMREQQVNGNLLLISTFNSRYQQLPLQLADVRKFFEEDDEEYIKLTKAIDSIKLLGAKANEMKVLADNVHLLKQVEKHLAWKSNMFKVNLNLSSPNRKFYFRGDLFRKGDLKINTTAVHVIVLDNYVLITERQRSNKVSTFKVTENPIPLQFLLFENRESDTQLNRTATPPTVGTQSCEIEEDSQAYSFKIRYAGRGKSQAHTLFAKSETERKKWISVFLQARFGVVKRFDAVNPFGVVLLEDSFFAYDQNSKITKLPIFASNDPLLAITKNSRDHLKDRRVPADLYSPSISRAQLLYTQGTCSETFTYRNSFFMFLGLHSGVLCSDGKNLWKKIVNLNNVTKLSVIPELSVVLVLANKELRYYPLQSLIDVYYERKERLSSFSLTNGAVLFYEYGRHKEVPTLFVARKKNSGTTTFKVFALEIDMNGILSSFSVIKRFYIQAECYGLSIFNTSIAVHTNRGFEILDLDKLVPRTVPELPPQELSSKKLDAYSRKKDTRVTEHIRKALAHTTPMGMYKLSNNKEFLLVYADCAVFVNKNGKLSRKSMICFDFRPRHCAFLNNHLVLVCEEVIEVWSISDFTSGANTLVQVIPGKDIQMMNNKSFEFRCANPKLAGLQVLFRLVPKEELFSAAKSADYMPA